jgi:tripartite-type tricarboxylate transporter receptor subunit TctC
MRSLVRALALLFAIAPIFAAAQDWPQKPIRFIIPYPPGGGSDALARFLGQKLSENLGQPVIIDNKPGGATIIGTELAAKAPADGYTMVLASPSFTNNVALYSKLPYDPEKDFEAVTLVASVPLVLVAAPSLPANNAKELVALAKTKPGKMSYAMATGSTPHLAGEMLKVMGGIDVLPIPYKGMAPAYPDLLTGRIDYMFDAVSTGLPNIQAGKTKALGVSSAKRSQAAPDIPTIAESGLPGFEAEGWYGIVVPKGTPPAVIAKLNAETLKALADAATAKSIQGAGFDIIGKGPVDFAAYMKSEQARWAKLIKQAGIKAE